MLFTKNELSEFEKLKHLVEIFKHTATMKELIQDSDRIVDGFFSFKNAWDMEQCTTGYRLFRNSFSYTPNEDPEWVYSLVRMEYCHKLVLAYVSTGKETYIESFAKIVSDFFRNNNEIDNSLQIPKTDFCSRALTKAKNRIWHGLLHVPIPYATYRTLDTSIRCYALSCDLLNLPHTFIKKYQLEGVVERIEKDWEKTIVFSDFDYYSNWGLIRILLYASYRLMLKKVQEVEWEQQIILKMLGNQIREDGGHIENSTMYHTQVLLCMLRFLYHAKRCGVEIQKEIKEYAERMCYFTFCVSAPNGKQIMYGDSDYTALDTVLYLSAQILGSKQVMNRNKPDDIVLLYEFLDYIDESAMALHTPRQKQNLILDGGVWCFDNESWSIRVFNESSHSMHKHADNGEVVIFFKDKPLLMDTGRCTYHDYNKRKFYRGPMAHNVAILDSGKEWDTPSKTRFLHLPHIEKISPIDNSKENNITGITLSYSFKAPPVQIRREIYVLEQSILVIISKMYSPNKHTIETVWNWMGRSIQNDLKKTIIDCSGDNLYVYYSSQFEEQIGRISFGYNQDTAYGVRHIVGSQFVDRGISYTIIADLPITVEENESELIVKLDHKHFSLNIFN